MEFQEKLIYRGELPKKGAWAVCRFKGWIGKKEGGVFEGERLIPQCTLYLQNLLIKLTVKVSSEKAWLGLLYDFPFALNPGDKPNDAQAWKNYLSLYPVSTEDQFQVNSKKN